MVFAEVSKMYEDLKQVTDRHIFSLNLLFTGFETELSPSTLQVMNAISKDTADLGNGIHLFSKKCLEDPRCTRGVIKDLDADLSSWLWLIRKIDEKNNLEAYPKEVPTYLFRVKNQVRRLRKQLRNETGYPPKAERKNCGPGSYLYDSATGVHVQFSNSLPEPDPGQDRTAPVPPKAQSSVGPQEQEFVLPGFLQDLPLKPQEKERFQKVLKFISTRPLEYKLQIYALLLADLDLVLVGHIGKTATNLYLARACKARDKNGRQAQGYRTLYRNPETSDQRDRFVLRDKFPEFEAQVHALLK